MPNKNEIIKVNRRKAVKTMLSGITALTAYNAFPAKWGTPIIEQVFLPAHAATSGEAVRPDNYIELVSFQQNGNISGNSISITWVVNHNDPLQPQAFSISYNNVTQAGTPIVIPYTTNGTGTTTFTTLDWSVHNHNLGDVVSITLTNVPSNLTLWGNPTLTLRVV